MFRDDILEETTQAELEKVCRDAQLSIRSDMEYMVMKAVKEAYDRGFEDGMINNLSDDEEEDLIYDE